MSDDQRERYSGIALDALQRQISTQRLHEAVAHAPPPPPPGLPPSDPAAASTSHAPAPPLLARKSTIPQLDELLRTEERYVDDLGLLCDVFLKPLRDLGVLEPADQRAIFSNCETLRGINQELLRSLRDCAGGGGGPAADPVLAVAAAFEKLAPFLVAYAKYCGDYVTAQRRLDELREARDSGALEAALQDAERAAGQPLSSLLIKPIQRLCKYPLLLRELRKAVGKADGAAHPSAAALDRAMAAVEGAAAKVNERVRKIEGQQLLRQLAANCGKPELVTPSRYVCLASELCAANTEGDTGFKGRPDVCVWLCNDVAILGYKQKLLEVMPLAECSMEVLQGATSAFATGRRSSAESEAAAADAGLALRLECTAPRQGKTEPPPAYLLSFSSTRAGEKLRGTFDELREKAVADAQAQGGLMRVRQLAREGSELSRATSIGRPSGASDESSARSSANLSFPTKKDKGVAMSFPWGFGRKKEKDEADALARSETHRPKPSVIGEMPPPPLKRGVTREEVDGVGRKVKDLSKMVKRLSTEGSALHEALQANDSQRSAASTRSAASSRRTVSSAGGSERRTVSSKEASRRREEEAAKIKAKLLAKAKQFKYTEAAEADDDDEWAED